MPQNAVIIDAATRFLRSNPELLEVASRGAGETGQAVDDLLADVSPPDPALRLSRR